MELDPVDAMNPDEVAALVDSWADSSRPMSKHLELAVSTAVHRARRAQPPLRDGEPVPGCDCPECTGVAADDPARAVPIRTRYRRAAYREPLNVEGARAVPLLEVARGLGLEPRRAGAEYVAKCPLHHDKRPSLRLNAARGLWYCHPCGEGGDGLRLVERVRGLGFPDAVRELTA